MSGKSFLWRVDWLILLLYLALSFFGWLNLYSTTVTDTDTSLFDFSTYYGKQLFFFCLSIVMFFSISLLDDRFFERFSSIFYFVGLFLLIGLFAFGETIAGATSWYDLGAFNFQPSEFTKLTTVLGLAKYLSDLQTDIKKPSSQVFAVLLILAPVALVVPQPDPGSALIFLALFLVLFYEGFPIYFLVFAVVLALLFGLTLMFGPILIGIIYAILLLFYFGFKSPSIKIPRLAMATFVLFSGLIISGTTYVFEEVFEDRHRDRFNLWLNLEKNTNELESIRKSIGYNTIQAEEAIASGRWLGKGFLKGTRTKGDFVPQQHTDYIFSSVGEEWGFIASALVIVAFILLLNRLVRIAERQKRHFNRLFGYGITAILLFHFVINIGMVLGLLPTIGIPLPFFSYGGSGQLFMSLMLFIFLKMDANRLNQDGGL